MSPPHDSGQGHSEPWVPEEPSPSGADTPAPHLVPMVVSEWERSQTEDGAVETLPQRLAIPRAAVTIKADEQRSRERVRRFVEAWRWLSRRRRRHTTSPGFSVYESDRHLAGAGVLVRVVLPARHSHPPENVPPPPAGTDDTESTAGKDPASRRRDES